MKKRMGTRSLRRNARTSMNRMDRMLDDMQSVLLDQIYACEDGRALARAHLGEGPLLIAGVFMLIGDLMPLDDSTKPVSTDSPIWDYLELGLELLGFKDESKRVRHEFDRVAIQMWCRGSGEISKKLDAFMDKQTFPMQRGRKSANLQLVR